MTIHLSAERSDIAETVLLPGDPLRAKGIAETMLQNTQCYNTVRGMLGYTGTYQGKKVSVQGSGMGMPSLSIYAEELISLGAKQVIRVGTCGALQADMELGDVVIATTASTDSAINRYIFGQKDYAPTANYELLRKAVDQAVTMQLKAYVGGILSSDSFYNPDPEHWKKWAEYGVLAVEMETSALYTIAAKHGVKALTILTVSDCIPSGKMASIQARQNNFEAMAQIALEIC